MEYNQIQYQSFLAEQIVEQSIMERYIMECVLTGTSQNSVKNIRALNESVSDKIKEGFKKILEAIGRMWGKFLEAMTNLINGNRAYLEKYKDIILKKKLDPNTTYTMYDYSTGIKRMLETPVPVFNYAAMEGELDTPEHFIENDQYLKRVLIKNSDATFADQAKAYFRGSADPIPLPSARLNMTDIFNYCYDYEKKMKPLLEKDLNSIKTAANNAAEIIDKAEREKNATTTPTEPIKSGEPTEAKKLKESYSMFGEKTYYSYVYEQVINELEISQGGANNGGNDNSPAKNMQNTQGEKPKPEDQNTAIKNDAASYDDKIKKVQNYLNVCGGLLAAKQTIAEEIFKEYMQIIKDHVRNNVGTSKKDTSNDKVADGGTNYKNVVDKALGGNNKETSEDGKKDEGAK